MSSLENTKMPIAIKDSITMTFDTINPNLSTMRIFLLIRIIFSWLGFISITSFSHRFQQ